MSSADPGGQGAVPADVAVTEPTAPEPAASDVALMGVLRTLTAALGDAVVGSHLKAGDDLWVRVRPDAWRRAAEVCRDQLAMRYFCYLSAIDWMPSPYGKGEDLPDEATDVDLDDEAGGADAVDDEAVDDEAVEAAAAVAADDEARTASPTDEQRTGYAGGDTRFQVLARLWAPAEGVGVTLKCDVDDVEPRIESWVPVYAGANWHERETWEMYGIVFTGHPNLIKLYLPGEFEGFPLRKDFPLLARHVKPWPGLVDVEPMPAEPAEPTQPAEPAEPTQPAEPAATVEDPS